MDQVQKLTMFIQQHCPPIFSYIPHHASESWQKHLCFCMDQVRKLKMFIHGQKKISKEMRET